VGAAFPSPARRLGLGAVQDDGTVIGLPYWNLLKNSLFVTLTSVVASTPIAPTNGLVTGAAVKG
jgi:hypothetical protein